MFQHQNVKSWKQEPFDENQYLVMFFQVSIVWPDQHMSVFDAEWLKKRCFSDAARQAMQEELFLNGEFIFIFSLQNMFFCILELNLLWIRLI